ncbi:MAG: hypothetical protein ABFR95_11270 [Actinomycetota bacterium]
MAEVRLLATGRVKDYEAAVDVLGRVCDIAAAVSGAVVWEAFADEASGVFVLNETFASEEALVEYERAVDTGRLRPVIGEVMELERLVVFSAIEDEHLNQVIDSMGGIRVTPVVAK